MAYTKQTHCKNGHELVDPNLYWTRQLNGTPRRQCRTCRTADRRAAQAELAKLTPKERETRRKRFPSHAKMKHYQRKYRYGLDEHEVRAIVDHQGGRCGICAREIRLDATAWNDQVHLDHDHETGEVRAALCRRCNAGIGFLGEDTTTMKRAVAYVQMSHYAKRR